MNAPTPKSDVSSGRAVLSDHELAAGVERLVGDLYWRITSETPGDLSRTAASMLRSLAETGAQRVTVLAAREPVAQPTMSVIVKRLEQRGLVQRERDPGDARATLVSITPDGLEILNQRRALRSQWFEAHLAHLGEADRRTVLAAVEILLHSLD